jgi:predicted AAA+ superfamily ATPase
MRLAATRVGRLLNQSEIGRDAGLAQPTAHRYLNLLEVGCQIARLEPYSTNPTSRIVKSKKLFWRDSGLAAWLARYRTPGELADAPDKGFWLEQALFQTLAVWASLDPTRRHLHYWRDRSGNEVDFVLEHDGDLVALEIKAGENVTLSDAKGLMAFSESLKQRNRLLKSSVVLHMGTTSRQLGPATYALPAGCFFPELVSTNA